jgi:sulfatase modifying factor 1
VASSPRPVTARSAAVVGEATASAAEIVSSIEDRIARQKADYKALNHAYERVRDAGSAASARTIALAAELAATRGALESEQDKTREFEKALAESAASGEAARLELGRVQMELRSVRELLAARDTAIGQLRLSLSEREGQLAALQADDATRAAAMDARASAGTRIEADLQAARARSTALGAELAGVRAALESAQVRIREADEAWTEKLASAEAARLASAESARREVEVVRKGAEAARTEAEAARKKAEAAYIEEAQRERARATALAAALASSQAAVELEHSKSRETRKALAERVAAEEAAHSQGEDALWKLEGYRTELSKARDLLAARQQEHTGIVAALEARTRALEAQLQDAATRVDVNQYESPAGQEITVAIDRPRERGASRPADRQAAAPQRESAPTARIDVQEYVPLATTVRIDPREAAPIAAPNLKRAAQVSEFPVFGTRRGPARFALVGGALVVLAVVTWFFIRSTPVSENASAVVPAAAPKPGSVIRDCPTCPALTVVPAGRFKQGSTHADGNSATFEKPPHWVLIGRRFAISTSAVTVDEFRPFIAATGRDMRGCDTYDDRWRIRPDANWENPGFVQTGSHPVTCVSWDDAKAYAGWLSRTTGHPYRLPSAAEWEYAARAGGEAVRPWNPDGAGACASANVADQRAARRYPGWTVFPCDDGYVYTAPVGSFKANSFGLNDMLGNVFQWTDDCWHADYTGVPTDGSARTYGDCSERELRGGSWFTTPEFVRASYRNHFGVNYRTSSVGIRLVRDIAP